MSEFSEPELTGLEASLARLRPQVGSLNRDQVLFRAGQASVRRGWVWPAAAMSFGLAAIALALAWWAQPGPAPEVRVVYLSAPAAPAPAPPAVIPEKEKPLPQGPALAYLHLREQLLRLGVDSLPSLPPLPPGTEPGPLKLKDLH